MNDLLLRFDDESTALSIFAQAGMTYIDENGNTQVLQYTHDYALDIIGIIPTKTNSGWCANLRLLNDNIDASLFDPYLIVPNSPYRVWA